MTGRTTRTSRSLAWSALENASASIISFGGLVLYARFLTPENFGIFATALAVVEMLSILSTMAFHDVLVQRANITEKHFNTAFTVNLVMGVVLSLACWVSSPLIGTISADIGATSLLGWLGLRLLVSAPSASLMARQRREFQFKTLAIRTLIGRLIGAALGICAVLLGAGVWGLVVQQVSMAAIDTCVLWCTCKRRPSIEFGKSEFFEMVKFGLPSVAGLFVNHAAERLFVIASGFFLGAASAGFMNMAFRLVNTFRGVCTGAISQVALPMLSSMQHDPVRLTKAYSTAVSLACVVLYPFFVGLGACAPEIVEILFGAAWKPSSTFTIILSLLIILQAPRIFAAPTLTALGRPNLVLMGYCSGLVYMLLAVAITKLRTPNIAIGVWAGCEILYGPVFAVLLSRARVADIRSQIKNVIAPLIAVLCMFGCIYTLGSILSEFMGAWARLSLLVPFGAVVYVLILFLLGKDQMVAAIGFFRSSRISGK